MTNLTPDFLNEFFLERKKHIAYDDTVKRMHEIAVHADGKFPEVLLKGRRPSEGEHVQTYREKIWQAITKDTFGKVITELGKIRKSDDWKIDYSQSLKPAKVTDKESLENYCEYNYPGFTSITNWAFAVLLKKYLVDANAAELIMPIEFEVPANEYRKPYVFIFTCEQVRAYVPDDYAILKSEDKCTYKDSEGKNTYTDGVVFYVATTKTIQRWEQVNEKKEMRIASEYVHNFNYLPVRITMGVFGEVKERFVVWDSRLNYMLPYLNEAVREYSDLQAEIVQHIFSEKWVIASQTCKKCNGAGDYMTKGKVPMKKDCDRCKGTGRVVNPYEFHVVEKPGPGETIVTPPAGYIQKNIDIAKLQDERVEKHLYKALAAINFQFLHKVPLNESGVAKEVDRDSLNIFVNYIAEDIVAHMDWIYKVIADYRYSVVIPSADERKKMLPVINVPSKFDILTSGYLMDEITKAKNAKVNPIVINALEMDYTNKKFSTDPIMRELLKCQMELDPLAGLTEDEKMSRLSNKGITPEMYVVSSSITYLVKLAYEELKQKFFTMDYKQKTEKIKLLAAPLMKEASAAAKAEEADKEEEKEAA